MADKHSEEKLKEIIEALNKLDCRKTNAQEVINLINSESSEPFAVMGHYNFYIVNPQHCQIRHDRNETYKINFKYEAVIRNIHVTSKTPYGKVNELKDVTEDTKNFMDKNEKVGNFELRSVYVAPKTIEQLLDNEIQKRINNLRKNKWKNPLKKEIDFTKYWKTSARIIV